MKNRRTKMKMVRLTENDLKSIAVKGWRKKVEDRSVQAVILKTALAKQYGQCTDEEEEEEEEEEKEEEEIVFRFSEKRFRIVRRNRKLRHVTQYQDISL
jgi:hypothetical protein